MKQYIQALLLGTVMTCLMTACYKDKGNYELSDYNKILSITTPSTSAVILGDTLRINPSITWKYPKGDTLAFEYEWRQIDSVVSTSRNLEYKPNISGYVMIYLYVKEKATGIVSRYVQQIQVQSAYKAGWLLLTNNGGKSGLTFIRRDAKKDANNQTYYVYKYFPDIYAQMFPGSPLGNNPVKLVTRAFPDYTLDEVLVIQGNTPVFLSGDNFSKKINLTSEFPSRSFPEGANVSDYADGGPTNFVLTDNGKMYWKSNSTDMGAIHQGTFFDVPIYFEGGGANITKILDASIDLTSFVYVYDQLNRRFIGLYTTYGQNDFIGGKMFLVNSTVPPPGFVDLNNQAGYTLKYCSDYANAVYYMNIIKNDATSQYLLQTYRLTNNRSSIGVSDHQQEVFAGNGLVNDNTVYYRVRNSSYLFFATGSKLYFYDVNTKIVTLYHDFGSGNIIKLTGDANEGELGVALSSGDFYICSLKNEVLGNANPGSVGILYQSPNVGTIVDLSWKWGSYYEYVFRRYPQ